LKRERPAKIFSFKIPKKESSVKEIVTKHFQDFSIRIFLFQNQELFFAKDTALLLGYTNPQKAIRDHCKKSLSFEDIFKMNDSFTFNLQQVLGNNWKQTKLIPEGDVWRLIIKSRLPEAQKIEEWIMEEVLPSIRQTGSYSISKNSLANLRERAELLEISEKEFGIFQRVFRELGITRAEELAITTNRAVKKETGVDFLEISEKRGVSTLENFITVTELCETVRAGDSSDEVKLSVSTKNNKPNPRKMNLLLEENGFQTRNGKVWKATEKGKEFSDFVQNKSVSSEKTVYHLCWKEEVLKELF
jgi:prophage antirepressor-like protein